MRFAPPESNKQKTFKQQPPPGPRRESKLILESGRNRMHWISPTRKIEFRKRPEACQFESLRQKWGSDEVKAWEEYRSVKTGDDTKVVNPQQYDAQLKSGGNDGEGGATALDKQSSSDSPIADGASVVSESENEVQNSTSAQVNVGGTVDVGDIGGKILRHLVPLLTFLSPMLIPTIYFRYTNRM